MQFISIVIVFYFVIAGVFTRNIFSQSNFSLTIKPTLSLSLPIYQAPPTPTPHTEFSPVSIPGFGFGTFFGYNADNNLKVTSGIEFKRKAIEYDYSYFDQEATIHVNSFVEDVVDQIGIPLTVSYYSISVNEGFFLDAGVSLDFFISGITMGRNGYKEDLTPYYGKIEVTLELGGGYDFSITQNKRFEISLIYSHPILNPYDTNSIANGYDSIKILRLGMGIIFLL